MKQNLTVLLVEDNPDDALLMQRAFQANGLVTRVPFLPDGAETIAYLCGREPYSDRSVHRIPDVLVVDLKMPRAGGFEVLEWLRTHQDYAVIPTVVWTSSEDDRDVKHAYCLGANAYLVKPSDFPTLKEMVANMLCFWSDVVKPRVEGRSSCDEVARLHHV